MALIYSLPSVASQTALVASIGVHHADVANLSLDECQEALVKAEECLKALNARLSEVQPLTDRARVLTEVAKDPCVSVGGHLADQTSSRADHLDIPVSEHHAPQPAQPREAVAMHILLNPTEALS